MEHYNPQEIEPHWNSIWKKEGTYAVQNDPGKPFCYVLDMFPYPSGAGLHLGHPRGYIASDIYSRFKRMNGFNVLHPMGWDSFGLPAENHAIKNKTHPRHQIQENIEKFKSQITRWGQDYDWSYEINTSDPDFYRWTQWMFLKMYDKGLVYQSYEPINWCPSCQTGLANEDVDADNTCERCGSQVEKKPMRQWVIAITQYADRLLDDLDLLEKWPQWVKEAQRHWIGKSSGAEVSFTLTANETQIPLPVFTTRPDTLYGCTYVVLAPDHASIADISHAITNIDDVTQYQKSVATLTEIERTSATREKTGVRLEGVTAINPVNNESVPVYIADYVLSHYGTGAIMAVPAHDERDFAFAKKFNLPIRVVVKSETDSDEEIYTGEGTLVSSQEFDGFTSVDAKEAITRKAHGTMKSTYRLRDWVFSRQRYWGEPIPLVHDADGNVYPLDESMLPLKLPEVEHYAPTGTGESPLANIADWANVKGYITETGSCITLSKEESAPEDVSIQDFTRETNTMPQWAGSSWYYFRYIDPKNETVFIDSQQEKQWLPVSVYVGGDHATRHLIYARFWHKFLNDNGYASTKEPFPRLEFLGYILAEDGSKFSKRSGNSQSPDDIIDRFGADALRTYEMFIGPFEKKVPWNTDGVVGTRRFLEKVWRQYAKIDASMESDDEIAHPLQRTIYKVQNDIEEFRFNTAVSAMMIMVNAMDEKEKIHKATYETFLKILAPFAPHIAEELWHRCGNTTSIHLETWPVCDEQYLVEDTITLPIQINGKTRGFITIPPDATEEVVVAMAKNIESIQSYIAGKDIKRIIYKTGKILSILTSE